MYIAQFIVRVFLVPLYIFFFIGRTYMQSVIYYYFSSFSSTTVAGTCIVAGLPRCLLSTTQNATRMTVTLSNKEHAVLFSATSCEPGKECSQPITSSRFTDPLLENYYVVILVSTAGSESGEVNPDSLYSTCYIKASNYAISITYACSKFCVEYKIIYMQTMGILSLSNTTILLRFNIRLRGQQVPSTQHASVC